MQHIPKWLLFIIIGFIFIGTIFVYAIQSYRYHDIEKLMKESAQIVMTESIDFSSRVDENAVIISEDKFEEKFKDRFENLSGFEVSNYSFKYRREGNFYKSIKIKIIDDQGSSHEITWVTDFNKSI